MLTRCLCDTAHDQPVLLPRSVIALRGLIEVGEHIKLLRARISSIMDAKGKSTDVEKEEKKKQQQPKTHKSFSPDCFTTVGNRSSEIHSPVSLYPRLGLQSACLVMQRMQYLCRCASQFQAKVAHALLISSLTRHFFFFFFTRFSYERRLVR